MNDKILIVIDTNIWISFLIGKCLYGLSDLIINDRISLLFSYELLDELIEVVQRPKLQKYFTKNDIDELINLIYHKAAFVEISTYTDECRDEKDNFLLNLCISGDADYLVTGDEDLLVLENIKDTTITSYKKFQKVIEELNQ